MSPDKLQWSLNAARELAMDSAHVPQIQAIIDRHYDESVVAMLQSITTDEEED